MLAADAGVAADVAPLAQPNMDIQSTKTVAMIDASLPDLDVLLGGLPQDTEIVLLDNSVDLISQVSEALSGQSNLGSLHLVTHGKAGQLVLGDQRIGAEELESRQSEIASWSRAMTSDADILIYGCEAGAGVDGLVFAQCLAKLTGADVAASSDITGSEYQNANWILETQVGQIESAIVFDQAAQDRYKHTLVIKINALGETGEESFDLVINGQSVASWNASQTQETYVYDGLHGSIVSDTIRVRFNNDLYDPDNGFDRNLFVNNIVVDGIVLESELSYTLSTGTWQDSDGIASGYGRGETLHANGEFVYAPGGPINDVWSGTPWLSNNDAGQVAVDIRDNTLNVISSHETAVWHGVELSGGHAYEFTVDAVRKFYGDGTAPFASVGIDFRDANGNEIEERVISIGGIPASQTIDFTAPQQATNATIWAWMADSPAGTTSEIVLSEVRLEKVDLSGDTTPPTATLVEQPPITLGTQTVDFAVDYTDDQRLSNSSPRIQVTGPNGFDQFAVTFTGSGDGVTQQQLLHGVFADPPFEQRVWGFQDNGVYTVTLQADSLIDQAGNAAPEQVLGTFEVAISDQVDEVLPTAALLTQNSSINDRGEAQFLLIYEDNQAPIRFINGPGDSVTITGPNGYQESTNGFAGGRGDEPFQTIEAFVLPTGPNGYQPGEYFVTIKDDYIVDIAGNVLPSQLLGSFILTVNSQPV